MANTDRRIITEDNKQFMPMNVEGSYGEKETLNTTKLIALGGIAASIIGCIIIARSGGYSIIGTIILLAIVLVIDSFVLRYIVFEEKLYYAMYNEIKDSAVVSPYKLWNIISRQNTVNGTVLNYNDAKMGVIVRIERGLTTGRGETLDEEHHDAISDFYKELNNRKLKRVRMDLMEYTSNDKRLNELDKLCNTTDNNNLNRLMELYITHIKNISSNTLTDVEYYLIYTNMLTDQYKFIQEVQECLDILMNGAYNGYEILGSSNARDINEFAKQINFIDYFNTDEASLRIFNMNRLDTNTINIIHMELANGDSVDTSREDIIRIKRAISNNKNTHTDTATIVSNTIKKKRASIGVDIDEIKRSSIKGNNTITSYASENNTKESVDEIDF